MKGITVTGTLLAACLLAAGCATTEMIAADIMANGRNLRKKMAFLPTVNDPACGDQHIQTAARTQLKTFLSRRCDRLFILDPGSPYKAIEKIPRLASGHVDKLTLTKLGRTQGLCAVLEQRIGPIELVTEKHGIWGFRDTCPAARLSLRLRAYEVETASVLFDDTIRRTVVLSEDERDDATKTGQYDNEIINRLLGKAIPEIGKKLCRRMYKESWKGYITDASGNTFTLTAGKDVGLAEGDVLEVFAMGEPIRGHGGHIYLIPGPKMGEIKVTRVQWDRAEAIGIVGSDLEKSNCVKLKP
ncbi:MAG: hypothetical protein HWN68_02105 [Desulfobacterales bacterium]|nr:hypothetical protein [Desulfobacterales bacterium]